MNIALFNLALVYQAQGRMTDADPLLKRALAIGEKGEVDQKDALAPIFYLAERYESLRLYPAAEDMHKRALRLAEKYYGANHQEVVKVLDNMIELYNTQGKYAEALPVAKRVLAIQEKNYGKNHAEISKNLNNMALIQMGLVAYDDAEQSLNRALAILEADRADHPNAAIVLDTISELYKKQGKAEMAAQADKRAKQIRSTWH